MRMKFNLDDVPEGGFKVLDSGVYLARVTDIEEEESSTGNPMLVWSWEVLNGGYEGSTLKSFTSLLEHAMFGLKNHLEAFGIHGEVDMDTSLLIGKKAELVVIKTTIPSKKGKGDMPTNRIEEVRPAKSGASPGQGKASSKGKSGKGSNIGGDEIPF